jgi:hypothetical protein
MFMWCNPVLYSALYNFRFMESSKRCARYSWQWLDDHPLPNPGQEGIDPALWTAMCAQWSRFDSSARWHSEMWSHMDFIMRMAIYDGNPQDPNEHRMLNIMRYREYQNILPYVADAVAAE